MIFLQKMQLNQNQKDAKKNQYQKNVFKKVHKKRIKEKKTSEKKLMNKMLKFNEYFNYIDNLQVKNQNKIFVNQNHFKKKLKLGIYKFNLKKQN